MKAIDEIEREGDGNQRQDGQQRVVHPLSVFYYHAFEQVGDVLAPVGGGLEEVVDFLPLDHGNRIALLIEEPDNGVLMNAVGLVLELADARSELHHAFALLESGDEPRRSNRPRHRRSSAQHVGRPVRTLLNLVQPDNRRRPRQSSP